MANITKEKRDRILKFINELKQKHSDDESIIALNEIENTLTEKKFGLVFEEHTEQADDMLKSNIPVFCADETRRICKDENKPYNFIIEGDNLHALYLLEKTHRGKVDCIYIDPPYNSGARDWKYNNDYVDSNDVYRHSKWLSMIKSRLIIAKRLLNPKDSVLICTIDEKEYLHLGCLLEEIFPQAKIQMVTDVINQKGVARDKEFSRVDEYIFFVKIGASAPCLTLNNMLHAVDTNEKKGTIWIPLQRSGSESLRTDRPNMCYPIFVDEKETKIVSVGEAPDLSIPIKDMEYNNGLTPVWPITLGREGRWQLGRETVIEGLKSGSVRLGNKSSNGKWTIQYLNAGALKEINEGSLVVNGKDKNGALIVERVASKLTPAKTVWNQVYHDASVYGSSLLLKIFKDKLFDFPKSIYSTLDAIKFFVSKKKNATIVDFFAGSGTTLHSVNLLNAEDNGNRKCIIVTNNEVSADEEKRLTKLGYKKGDPEWERLGIANYVTWPRTLCSINGVNVNGESLKGNYLIKDSSGKEISMSDGFVSNVKYFRCGWVDRKPEDYLLSNALCLHIKEMIEIQNAIEIDNKKYVLILNKKHFNDYIRNNNDSSQIRKVWINQNIIFDTEEMKILRQYDYKYVPKEFFGQELKEVAE